MRRSLPHVRLIEERQLPLSIVTATLSGAHRPAAVRVGDQQEAPLLLRRQLDRTTEDALATGPRSGRKGHEPDLRPGSRGVTFLEAGYADDALLPLLPPPVDEVPPPDEGVELPELPPESFFAVSAGAAGAAVVDVVAGVLEPLADDDEPPESFFDEP